MEEFKIITLPQKENTEENTEDIEAPDTDEDYQPPRRRFLAIFLLVIALIIALAVVQIVTTYSDYQVENSWERNDASESKYEVFKNNLIKYSTDGIFYTTYNGSLIWNYTYNMTNPQLDIGEDYIIAYDKKGTEIDIFSQAGYINTISLKKPIIEAKVAQEGTVAVMLQENGVTYIQMYNTKGTALVSGEIHPENNGYPISMALSSDAKRLALSVINVNTGNITSNVIFYDFSSAGKEEIDNIVASYTYVDMIIPQIEFLDGDKAVAFGENEIIIFNDNTDVTVEKEIYLDSEIKNLFYNNKYFGYTTEVTNDNGDLENRLVVYNLLGFQRLKKDISDSYESINILDNNEIQLNDDGNIVIYNLFGIKKFQYSFDENIYKVIPGTTSHRYYLIKETATEEIHLK